VIITSDNPRKEVPAKIISDILDGLSSKDKALVEEDRRKAIGLAVSEAGADDLILIAGKGHETYQLIGEASFPFDDREVSKQRLLARAMKDHS
jgi:UDP-N-acetylmuramoyl-L-alanyl-D-glutamate--2,6-diaminopimelate ligase